MPEIEEKEAVFCFGPPLAALVKCESPTAWGLYFARAAEILQDAVVEVNGWLETKLPHVSFGDDYNSKTDIVLGTHGAGKYPSTERMYEEEREYFARKPYFLLSNRTGVPDWPTQCRRHRFYIRCDNRTDALNFKRELDSLDWMSFLCQR